MSMSRSMEQLLRECADGLRAVDVDDLASAEVSKLQLPASFKNRPARSKHANIFTPRRTHPSVLGHIARKAQVLASHTTPSPLSASSDTHRVRNNSQVRGWFLGSSNSLTSSRQIPRACSCSPLADKMKTSAGSTRRHRPRPPTELDRKRAAPPRPRENQHRASPPPPAFSQQDCFASESRIPGRRERRLIPFAHSHLVLSGFLVLCPLLSDPPRLICIHSSSPSLCLYACTSHRLCISRIQSLLFNG
ncbi:hypothetical protein FB45DRAFT_1061829, partial [Roridomyces roridus]